MPAVSEKQRRAAFAALTVKRGKKMAPTKDYGKKGKGKPSKAMAQMPTEKLTHFTKMKRGKRPRKA